MKPLRFRGGSPLYHCCARMFSTKLSSNHDQKSAWLDIYMTLRQLCLSNSSEYTNKPADSRDLTVVDCRDIFVDDPLGETSWVEFENRRGLREWRRRWDRRVLLEESTTSASLLVDVHVLMLLLPRSVVYVRLLNESQLAMDCSRVDILHLARYAIRSHPDIPWLLDRRVTFDKRRQTRSPVQQSATQMSTSFSTYIHALPSAAESTGPRRESH